MKSLASSKRGVGPPDTSVGPSRSINSEAYSKEFEKEQNQKAKLLSLHVVYVDMQIHLKHYMRAEEVARKAWEECKDDNTDDSRLSYRQLCKVFREQGSEKYDDLDDVLRETWPGGYQ